MDVRNPPAGSPRTAPPAGTPDPPLPPAVPDYQLLRCIGRGSYGDVWLARNILGDLRAVKLVFRDRFSDPRPFEREFEGIQRFEPISRSHPSQLHILHVGMNDAAGCFYYVMELADDSNAPGPVSNPQSRSPASAPAASLPARAFSGLPLAYAPRTLRSELDASPGGRLPIPDCLRIGHSLATALQHLHDHKLVHRDIKPSNIIFVNEVAKLGDIGLVTDAGDTRSIVGTEGYLPPEGPGTPAADLYSLGKVLYEISTGQDRRRFPELPDDLRLWPDANSVTEFNEVLLKACAKTPDHRYTSAEAMRRDFDSLQQGRPVRRHQPPHGRGGGARTLATALASVLLAGSIAYFAMWNAKSQLTFAAEGPPSTNEWANALCDKALTHLRFDNYSGFGQIYTNLHRAIELDRHFARPYVGLFELRTLNRPHPGLEFRTNETLRTIAQRLTELGPDLAATYCAQSCLSFWDLDFPKAKRLAQKAAAAAPAYEFGRMCYGFMLTEWGLPEEGRTEIDAARRLQPSQAMTYRCYGHLYYLQRDFTNASAMYRRTIEWEPHHRVAYLYLAYSLQALGDYSNYSNSISYLAKAKELDGASPLSAEQEAQSFLDALRLEGIRGYWEEAWRRTAQQPDDDFYWKATVRCRLGDIKEAFRYLNLSWETRERDGIFPPIICLLFDEVWDPLHSDPRFQDLLRKVGFTKVNPKLPP